MKHINEMYLEIDGESNQYNPTKYYILMDWKLFSWTGSISRDLLLMFYMQNVLFACWRGANINHIMIFDYPSCLYISILIGYVALSGKIQSCVATSIGNRLIWKHLSKFCIYIILSPYQKVVCNNFGEDYK